MFRHVQEVREQVRPPPGGRGFQRGEAGALEEQAGGRQGRAESGRGGAACGPPWGPGVHPQAVLHPGEVIPDVRMSILCLILKEKTGK